MTVLGVNKILGCCLVCSNGRKYTCITKIIDGELYFHFKKEWHNVAKYISENAEELIKEDGKIFSRPFKK